MANPDLQSPILPPPADPAAITSWRQRRFGIFIHWGLYSLQGRGEWALFTEQQDLRDYARLAERFTGQGFDAPDIAAVIKDAGAGYLVMTARHHDGFCLWDSQTSDFSSMRTAARRDFIGEMASALRAQGLGVGFYYSPMDWRFPGFFFPRMYQASAEAMRAQCHAQVRELSSNYGPLDVLWYDGGDDWWLGHGGIETGPDGWRQRCPFKSPGWMSTQTFKAAQRNNAECPGFWQTEALNAEVRQRQPGILINDRSGSWAGDFDTREQEDGGLQAERPWERCATLAGSWGWTPEHPTLAVEEAIRLLARIACRDGNLLLNISPGPDGSIDAAQRQALAGIGAWMRTHGDTIVGTRGGPFKPGAWGGATWSGTTVFLHLPRLPQSPLVLPDLPVAPQAVRLRGGGELDWRRADGWLTIKLPSGLPAEPDTIIEVHYAERCW